MSQDDQLVSGESEVGEREGFGREENRSGDGSDERTGRRTDDEVVFGGPEIAGVVNAVHMGMVSKQ